MEISSKENLDLAVIRPSATTADHKAGLVKALRAAILEVARLMTSYIAWLQTNKLYSLKMNLSKMRKNVIDTNDNFPKQA